MHYKEIADKIVADKLRANVGATPAATVAAQISASIKHDLENSPYQKVSRGVFQLKGGPVCPPLSKGGASELPATEIEEETEDQYDIVTSFGMFWRKEAIEWKAKPKILGMQQIGTTAVDFYEQLGIYLLYDGREVIYVGRTTDRPLGKRLYEHTLDRLSVRWDRFSWFGLLPITEEGQIGKLPATYVASKMIPALEAILIEAMEPRQNRKRGDDLSAVEYLQKEDPAIAKKKIKGMLDNLG
jgi:hypothetical protein